MYQKSAYKEFSCTNLRMLTQKNIMLIVHASLSKRFNAPFSFKLMPSFVFQGLA
jgi:hypothetical protein